MAPEIKALIMVIISSIGFFYNLVEIIKKVVNKEDTKINALFGAILLAVLLYFTILLCWD